MQDLDAVSDPPNRDACLVGADRDGPSLALDALAPAGATTTPAVGTEGTHLVVDYRGCDLERLDDPAFITRALRGAAEAAGATVLGVHVHRFNPQGIAGVAILAESHLSIHTWPETGYAAADFYTCGICSPLAAHEFLASELRASRSLLMEIARGTDETDRPESGSPLLVRRLASSSSPTA